MIRKNWMVAGAGMAAVMALPGVVLADDFTLNGNVGLFSQYVDRGVAKSNEDPALQADFAVNHSSGFYAHVWGTNISILTDSGQYTSNSLELIPHLGFKNMISDTGIGYDLGVRRHFFPGDVAPGMQKNDTTEVYGGLNYMWAGVNVIHATDGPGDGTNHYEIYGNVPVSDSGFIINLKYTINDAGSGGINYNDWKVGGTYALPQSFTLGAYYTGTNLPTTIVNGNDVGDNHFVAFISKDW